MNRSEFYQLAGRKLADELDDEAGLTALVNAVIARAGQPSAVGGFLSESQRLFVEGVDR